MDKINGVIMGGFWAAKSREKIYPAILVLEVMSAARANEEPPKIAEERADQMRFYDSAGLRRRFPPAEETPVSPTEPTDVCPERLFAYKLRKYQRANSLCLDNQIASAINSQGFLRDPILVAELKYIEAIGNSSDISAMRAKESYILPRAPSPADSLIFAPIIGAASQPIIIAEMFTRVINPDKRAVACSIVASYITNRLLYECKGYDPNIIHSIMGAGIKLGKEYIFAAHFAEYNIYCNASLHGLKFADEPKNYSLKVLGAGLWALRELCRRLRLSPDLEPAEYFRPIARAISDEGGDPIVACSFLGAIFGAKSLGIDRLDHVFRAKVTEYIAKHAGRNE